MIVKRFQNRVAESRIALPVTGVYAFAVCALGGLFTEQLWVQFVLLAVSSFLMMAEQCQRPHTHLQPYGVVLVSCVGGNVAIPCCRRTLWHSSGMFHSFLSVPF